MRGWAIQVNKNGTNSSTPILSPTHHTHHTEKNAGQGMMPAKARLATPLLALTNIATIAPPSSSPNTSRKRVKELSNFTKRCSRVAPSSGPKVLPSAMPAAVINDGLSVALIANAPRKTPGQTERPNNNSATSAMPVGGHTAVTCCVVKASNKPNLAATK